MKNKILLAAILIVCLACTLGLASCKQIKHTVTFETYGGSAVSSQEINTGTKIAKPTDPVKKGYTFEGWFEDSMFEVEVDFSNYFVADDVTIYAKWSANTYKVTFDYQGGTEFDEFAYIVFDTQFTFAVSELADHIFVGWYSQPDGKGIRLTGDDGKSIGVWSIDKDTDVYVYFALITNTVTLDVNEGDALADDTAEVGVNRNYTLPVPTRQYYAFTGWYDKNGVAFTDEQGNSLAIWTIYEDITLYARWAKKQNTLTLDVGVGEALSKTEYVVYEGETYILPIATSPYYIFLGWYNINDVACTDDEGNSLSIWEGDGNITLYAKWEFIYNTVTLDVNGGEALTTTEFVLTAGSHYILPVPTTTAADVVFKGWYDANGVLHARYNGASRILWTGEGDITLTAQWVNIFEQGLTFTKTGEAYDVSAGNAKTADFIFVPATYLGIPVTRTSMQGFIACAAKTIVFSEGLINIQYGTFTNCTSLEVVVIPCSVTAVDYSSFSTCSSLTYFYTTGNTIPVGNGLYAIGSDGNVVSENGVAIILKSGANQTLLYAAKSVKSIIIPSSVTAIGQDAFRSCVSLKSVTLSEGLLTIAGNAFLSCTSLDSIAIPSTVTSIGANVFQFCTSLDNVELDGVYTTLSNYLFNGCTSLESISIPGTVTSIGQYVFAGCTSLTTVFIPESVTSIAPYAFQSCSLLSTINTANAFIPSGNGIYVIDSTGAVVKDNGIAVVVVSGSGATHTLNFAGGAVKSLIIPSTVTSIGQYSLQNCTLLVSVTILNGVTTIATYAFQNCSSLGSITIPDSVTSIGTYAFSDCSALKSATIGYGVTSILGSAFRQCYGLEVVTIYGNNTVISQSAFQGSAQVPWKIQTLTLVNVKEIQMMCFTGMTIDRVIILKPFTQGVITLAANRGIESANHIYVPDDASVTAYKAAAGWSAFAGIIEVNPDAKNETEATEYAILVKRETL